MRSMYSSMVSDETSDSEEAFVAKNDGKNDDIVTDANVNDFQKSLDFGREGKIAYLNVHDKFTEKA